MGRLACFFRSAYRFSSVSPRIPRVGCAVFFRPNPHGHVEQIRTPFSERVVVPLVKHQYDIMEHRLVLLDLDLFPVCSRQDLDYVGPKVAPRSPRLGMLA